MANIVSIITMLAALVALTLSIICIVKREKYSSALVMTDKDAIGLQNFDIQALNTTVTGIKSSLRDLYNRFNALQQIAITTEDEVQLSSTNPDKGYTGTLLGYCGSTSCGNYTGGVGFPAAAADFVAGGDGLKTTGWTISRKPISN